MTVALLLVTHKNIGSDMLAITRSIFNDEPNNTACVEIPMDANISDMKRSVADALAGLSTDRGVLILTDSYGSTPSNVAKTFLDQENTILVSGLNLPMLIRVMNYRSLPLTKLGNIAVEGGKKGIICRTN